MWDLGRPTLGHPLFLFRRHGEKGGAPYFLMEKSKGHSTLGRELFHSEREWGMEDFNSTWAVC